MLMLTLVACGFYLGSEGGRYNGGKLTGLRTEASDKATQEAIKKASEEAYKAGEDDKVFIHKDINIVDNSVEVVSSDKVAKATAGALGFIGPYGPMIPPFITFLLSLFITKRKKAI